MVGGRLPVYQNNMSTIINPYRFAAAAPASFDPSIYGTVTQFLWADDIAGNDGDSITTWAKHTYGNDAVASGGHEPVLKKGANGINGKNALSFNGSNQFMSIATPPDVRTIFIVVKGGTGGLQSPGSPDTSNRLGLIFPDSTSWYSGDGNDKILITRVNGTATLAHSPTAREVVSGTRADIFSSAVPLNIGSATSDPIWLWNGLISMWLSYSDAPDRATVETAIIALY